MASQNLRGLLFVNQPVIFLKLSCPMRIFYQKLGEDLLRLFIRAEFQILGEALQDFFFILKRVTENSFELNGEFDSFHNQSPTSNPAPRINMFLCRVSWRRQALPPPSP